MTYGSSTHTAPSFLSRLPIWTRGGRTLSLIAFWLDRRRQRRDLAWLDEHLLQDIGVSRGEAEHEIAKPFWR